MRYDEIHPVLRQVLGCREGFRKLGFSADDLYIEVARHPLLPANERMVFATLKTPRGKIFRVDAGPWPESQLDTLEAQWRAACEALNDGRLHQLDADRIWAESRVCEDKIGFVTRLLDKGIVPPKGWD